MTKIKTPKEYLQEKYPVMKEHWDEHEIIDDEWVAQMMQEYAESYHAQFEEDMFLNMQYYMEFCEREGYVTPQDWIALHKHF
jgi:hypothetical protein